MVITDSQTAHQRLCRMNFTALIIVLLIFLLQPLEGRADSVSSKERQIQVTLTADEPVAQKHSARVVEQKIEGEELRNLLHQLPPLQESQNQNLSFPKVTKSMPRPLASVEIPELKLKSTKIPTEPCTTQFLLPLQVDRISPNGKLNDRTHASFLVHFNQDMVALTSVDKNNSYVPVKLTPEIAGKWHWSDTKTLNFVPNTDVWPGSTTFTVKVPNGVTALDGAVIQPEFKGTFATTPLWMKFVQCGQYRKGKPPLLMVTFDQAVDPSTILQHMNAAIVLENNRREPVELELATPDEYTNDANISGSLEHNDGSKIVLKCSKSPNADQQIAIVLKAGAHSKEGPIATEQDQVQTVTPEQKFRVTSWSPLTMYNSNSESISYMIAFSEYIEDDADIGRFVHVSPNDPNAKIKAFGREILIEGLRRDKNYLLSISGAIRSADGQSLGKSFRTSTRSKHFEQDYKITSDDLTLRCSNNFLIAPSDQLNTTVFSCGFEKLKVSAFSVDINDFEQFVSSVGIRDDYENSNSEALLNFLEGKNLIKTCQMPTVESGPYDRKTIIDLTPFVQNRRDRILMLFEGKAFDKTMRYCQWIELGNMALNCWSNSNELSVLCSDARTGTPIADAELSVITKAVVASIGRTNKEGIAKLPLPMQLDGEPILVAKTADHSVLLPKLEIQTAKKWFEWYVMHDRGVYRPGEQLFYKGWLRQLDDKIGAEYKPPDQNCKTIIAVGRDAMGTEVYRERRPINEFGGFDGAFSIPKTSSLGILRVRFELEGTSQAKQIAVNLQEFRRPEYTVSLSRLDKNDALLGEPIHFLCEANYFSGGAANNATCNWTVDVERAYYEPPGWPQFSFACADNTGELKKTAISTKTDITGKSMSTVVLNGNYAGPVRLKIRSTLMDLNRQAHEEGSAVNVHSCHYYAGIKGECRNNSKNARLEFCGQLIVTDLQGLARENKTVKLSLCQVDEKEKHDSAIIETKSVSSSSKPTDFVFGVESGKQYSVIAEITDEQQRVQRSIYRFKATLSEKNDFPIAVHSEDGNLEELHLSADRVEYKPGETAQVEICSRIADGVGLATVEQPGTIVTIPFHVQQHSAVLQFPIGSAKTAMKLDAFVLGKLEKTAFAKMNVQTPEFAFCDKGSLRIKINSQSRRLNIVLHPDSKTKCPNDNCVITAQVRDADGSLAPNCEVTLFVVDEAALALSDYRPTNPADLFETPPKFNLATNSQDYLSTNVFFTAALSQIRGQLNELQGENSHSYRTEIRTNFAPTAIFKASLVTDADGKVQTSFNLPGSISKYKIYAFAADKGFQFGMGESELFTQLPLVLRPSPPRSLNLTDQFEMPVVVQNATDQDETISIVARGNFANLRSGSARKVLVPARDRVEVRFPCVADQIGTAQFQTIARSTHHSDAAQISIPVLLPNSKETFATYGSVSEDETLAQKIELPADVLKDYGGLDLSASSAQFQELNDASNYMQNYPYDCSEQVAARIITLSTLRDLQSSFKAAVAAKNYSPDSDLAILAKRQNKDGSFSLWQRGEKSYPYVSIFATHALVVARNCGYVVPDSLIDQASNYLKTIKPSDNRTLSANLCAYALFVRSLLKEDVTKSVTSLSAELNSLSPEGIAWLLHAIPAQTDDHLRADLKSRLFNQLYETASTAGLKSSDALYGYNRFSLFYSDARADALLLDTLVDADPSDVVIPKIVKGLLLKRTNGHWLNTQENAFASLALAHYFSRFESEIPNFDLRAWFGENYILGKKFAGRSLSAEKIMLPMDNLKSCPNPSTLTLQKNGKGKLYYRLALNYAPSNPMVKEHNNGFEVKRVYESLNDGSDVRCDASGILHVKAGAMLRVKLNVRVDGARFHSALVDRLPAGFEPVNMALRGAVKVGDSKGFDEHWYDHENLRDDRVEIFASQLAPGSYTYSYYVRATTPGRFIAPPANAEEMYNPETYGRCSASAVVVE